MRHEFLAPSPLSRVWPALCGAQVWARSLPDFVVDQVESDHVRGRLKIRFGSTSVTYQCELWPRVDPDAPHALRLRVTGTESRGGATSVAELTVRLVDADGQTRVILTGDVTLAGRTAGLAPGPLAAGGRRTVERFASQLAEVLAAEPDAVDGAGQPAPVDRLAEPVEPDRPAEPARPAVELDLAAQALASPAEPAEDDPLGLLAAPARPAGSVWLASAVVLLALLFLARRGLRRSDGR